MLFRRLVVRFWADSSSLRVSRSSSSLHWLGIWMRLEETSCIVSHLWWVKEHWGINQCDNEAEGANDAQLLCRSSPEDDDWGRNVSIRIDKVRKMQLTIFLLFNSSATLTYFALFYFASFSRLFGITFNSPWLCRWIFSLSLSTIHLASTVFLAGMIYARWKTLKNLIFPLSKKAFISARSARKFFAAYQIKKRKKLSTEARMIYVNLCGWWGKTSPNITEGLMSLALIHSEEIKKKSLQFSISCKLRKVFLFRVFFMILWWLVVDDMNWTRISTMCILFFISYSTDERFMWP